MVLSCYSTGKMTKLGRAWWGGPCGPRRDGAGLPRDTAVPTLHTPPRPRFLPRSRPVAGRPRTPRGVGSHSVSGRPSACWAGPPRVVRFSHGSAVTSGPALLPRAASETGGPERAGPGRPWGRVHADGASPAGAFLVLRRGRMWPSVWPHRGTSVWSPRCTARSLQAAREADRAPGPSAVLGVSPNEATC